MKLELEFFNSYCSTSLFTINGIRADYYDFGDKQDVGTVESEDYGCEDMQFIGSPCTHKVLDKYGINETEYFMIARQLEAGLSFGSCGWCD